MRSDQHFMSLALKLAQKGEGKTSPNPMVGAVIVKNGKILATGFHHKAGFPHAEIEALKKIKFKAKGATLYCNLEPCCHFGRTPPCVDKIIQSGITRVVIAHEDPNPKVKGRSIKKLKKAGIKVDVGVLKKEALFLNRFFITWVTKKRPYIILKAAVSRDGKIAPDPKFRKKREPFWLTGPKARGQVHELRSRVDAILVGVNTVIADNPHLTVRGKGRVRQPFRIVLGRRSRIPKNSKIFGPGGKLFIARPRTLSPFLRGLAKKGVTSILVEGGAQIFKSFLNPCFYDEIILFPSRKILGAVGVNFPFILRTS